MAVLWHLAAPDGVAPGRGYSQVVTARDAVIDTARPPASTAVQVAALFAPGYRLEAEAWALVGDWVAGHSVMAGHPGRSRQLTLSPARP